MGCCRGVCCAAFPYTSTPEQLRERWADREPKNEREFDIRRDDLMISEMLVQLTPDEIRERGEKFDLWGRFESLPVDLPEGTSNWGVFYTCKNWNEATRLCEAYEERPKMCAEYPYTKKCEHACDYRPSDHIITRRLANEVHVTVWEASQAKKKAAADG